MVMMKDIAADGNSGYHSTILPLSALRLLVPPLRLLSAAIWKTVQRRDVADYGILEEFVTMVTDLVPELLTRRQKAQLTLGLRARLTLNTCQLGAPCESENVQPHLDRMQELIQAWLSQANGGNPEMSSSEFIDLVQNLLKNPDEKEQFFQKVFEEEFGSRYDEAIQALMWLFLTRLEKLLPVQTFHQVASMFGQGSCTLEECVQSVSTESVVTPVSWCDEIRAVLQFHKDPNQLDQNDLHLDRPCIISALRLPTAQTAETVQTPDRSIIAQSPAKEDSAALLCSFQINANTERFTNEAVMDKHHLASDKGGTQPLLEDEIRPDKGVDVLGVRGDPMSCLIKECCVRLQRLDKLVDVNIQPVRAARNLRLKRILQEEKHHLLQDTPSTSSEASEKEVSSPLHEDSFMAPVSTSSEDSIEDSWSYYSENSCDANTTSAADSWSIYSGDDSSVLCPVNSLAESDSFSRYSNSNCTFLNPKNASTSSQDRTLKKTQNPLCFICKEQVNKSLRMHMKTHFPNKDYTCPQCDGRYNLLTSLLRHMKKTCFDYPQQGGDPDELNRTQDLSKCEKCGDQFRYRVSLQKHMMTHHELYCSVCRRVLRDAGTLARHKTSHTPFQCTRCDQFFTVFKHLLRHYENIHKVSRPFQCNHCHKTCPRLRFLIRHEWQHTGCLPFQCTLCNLKFKSDCDLVAHQRVHTREKPYLCADCGKTFARKSNLLRHLRVIHSESRNEKRYSCSQCDKSFKEKGSLKKHQRSKHFSELSRYPCPYCGKMVSSSTMARHKLIHTGERPFKCTMPKCDKCFRSSTEVKRHVLQHHTKVRPFKCHTCGKGFVRTCDLNAHTRIHSEEKPCVCPICNKAFLKLYSMQRHKRLVHGVITH
uniref:C2H2-type domain-containing protein n=4 Tax=Iconisemion striatum TaxID=60296 RepID=A0A1A7XLX6_9TELE